MEVKYERLILQYWELKRTEVISISLVKIYVLMRFGNHFIRCILEIGLIKSLTLAISKKELH